MTGFILRRLAQAVIVVIGVTIFTFLLQHLIPGNIARAIVGPRATPAQIAGFDKEWGLNKALPLQYFSFVDNLAHGNLGYSYKQNRSVDSIVGQYLPRDVLLVGTSLIIALIIALPLGMLQAVRRNHTADYVGTGVSFLLYSMPTYLLGLLLIAAFSIQFRIFPPSAPQAATITGILAHPSGLVLPIATLTLVTCALFSRYMRSSAIDSLTQDYIRTARREGPLGAHDPAPARDAELPHPHRHPGGAVAALGAHRGPHGRVRVQLPGPRARLLQRCADNRLPGRARDNSPHRRGDRGRQSHCRPRLCHLGPTRAVQVVMTTSSPAADEGHER